MQELTFADPVPPPAARDRAATYLLPISLALATLVAFHQVRYCAFVNWDDDVYVYDNLNLRAGVSSAGLHWALTGVCGGYWIPLTWLSLLVDYQVYGLRPWGYHLTNLLLHVGNALLAYALFRRWTGQSYRSFVAAALFALHPLRVESVAWVTERKDVLSACFGLLTLLAYQRYALEPGVRRYLLVMAAFALSLLAKPMLVTLPCLLLLLDYWPLRRWQPVDRPAEENGPPLFPWRRLLAEKLPLLVLALVCAAITWHTQKEVGAVQSLEAIPLATRAANATIAYARYLQMTVMPVGLAPLYPYARERLTADRVALACLLLAAVSALTLWQARRRPVLIVGWLWFLGVLLPVSGLFQSGEQALADRFTYFSSLGLVLALTWGAADGLEMLGLGVQRFGRKTFPTDAAHAAALPTLFCTLLTLAVLGASAVSTGVQTRRWRDSVTLWTWTLQVTSRNAMAHHNLGEALEKRRHLDAAVTQFDLSLRINPAYPKAHYNRAVALEQMGRPEEALVSLQRACGLDRQYVPAHFNQGVVLFRLDRPGEAEQQFKRVLELEPSHARARFNLGLSQLARDRPAEAAESFQAALRLAPSAAWYKVLGHALMLLNRNSEAVEAFEAALRLEPADLETRAKLRAAQKR